MASDAEVTGADREKAATLTGCVLADAEAKYGPPFCAAHDEDGNPPWHRCRWVPIAQALADERAKARAPFLALADRLEVSYRRLPEDAGAALAADLIHRAAEDPT